MSCPLSGQSTVKPLKTSLIAEMAGSQERWKPPIPAMLLGTVRQRAAEEKFHREVVNTFRILALVRSADHFSFQGSLRIQKTVRLVFLCLFSAREDNVDLFSLLEQEGDAGLGNGDSAGWQRVFLTPWLLFRPWATV